MLVEHHGTEGTIRRIGEARTTRATRRPRRTGPRGERSIRPGSSGRLIPADEPHFCFHFSPAPARRTTDLSKLLVDLIDRHVQLALLHLGRVGKQVELPARLVQVSRGRANQADRLKRFRRPPVERCPGRLPERRRRVGRLGSVERG